MSEDGKLDNDSEQIDYVAKHPTVTVEAPASTTPEESIWQCINDNRKVVFYSLSACVSAMLWGYDIGEQIISFTWTRTNASSRCKYYHCRLTRI